MKNEMLKLATREGRVGKEIFFANFDLVFPEFQTTTILGASGVGKSTLLRILAGQIKDTSVLVDSPFSRAMD